MTRFIPRATLRLPAALALLGALALGCSDAPTGPGTGGSDYAHDRAVGASAHDLLSADAFVRLVVQVQYVEGAGPTQQGLAHLEAFLNARLNKPGGIEIRRDEDPIGPATGRTYSAADIRALEQEHRTEYTRGDTLAAYLIFVDGEYTQANVLGIAYNNTSTALFGQKIQQNTGGIGQPQRVTVEGTVANHEFGHIMGLVNNGSDMQEPHQDPNPEHGRHCDDSRCLMYYAVRTTDFLANLIGAGPPGLDQNCIDDLRANGGK
jgi:hypothetical protein